MILDFPEIELTKNNALIFTTQLPLMIQHKEEFWKTLSNQEKTLDMSALASGLYMIVAWNEEINIVKRIEVQR